MPTGTESTQHVARRSLNVQGEAQRHDLSVSRNLQRRTVISSHQGQGVSRNVLLQALKRILFVAHFHSPAYFSGITRKTAVTTLTRPDIGILLFV